MDSTTGGQDGNSQTHHKLADLTIFLMKLIQRLETQSYSNVSENPHLRDKIKDKKYIQQRQSFMDLRIPKSPDQLLKEITDSPQQVYIDEYLMPKLIAMAKNHVDAINVMYQQSLPKA